MGQPNTPYARTGFSGAPSSPDDGAAPNASPWARGSSLPGEIPGWQPDPAPIPQQAPRRENPYVPLSEPAPRHRAASQGRSAQRAPRPPRPAAPVPGLIGDSSNVPQAVPPTAAPAPTPRRGSLRIVSNDPNEIRRYAEAQRLSRTGAFVPVSRPAEKPSTPVGAPSPAAQMAEPPVPPMEPRNAQVPQAAACEPAHAPSVAVPDPSMPLAEREHAAKPSAHATLATRLERLRGTAAAVAGEERTWRLAIMWLTSVACVLATITMLYFPAQELYLAMRENERLTDELARNTARNEQMLDRVTALQTAEGIQDEARRAYGLTLPYDNPVTVVGLDMDTPSTTIPAEVPRGSGQNTHTWATNLLDGVFGAVGSSATMAEAEDRATVVEGSSGELPG